MATSAVTVTGLLPQTNGASTSFTSSGFGTPTGALIFASIANSSSNPNSFYTHCIAFWDGTNTYSHSISSDNAQATSSTYSYASVTEIEYGYQSAPLQFGVSSTTDGISLTLNSATGGNQKYATVILFKGTTNVSVGSQSLGTGTSAIDITAPGFKPDLVFFTSVGKTTTNHTYDSNAHMSFGVAHNSGTDVVTQGNCFWGSRTGLSTTITTGATSHSYVCSQYVGTTLQYNVTAGSFDANGFSLTPSASASSEQIMYLAIELANPDDAWVDVITAATSTGNDAHSGLGFEPAVVGFASSALATSLDTATNGNSGLLAASDGTTQSAIFDADDHNVGTTAGLSEYSSTTTIELQNDAGTTDAVATTSSIDADGFTLNYSDAAAGATQILAFAVGDSTGAIGVNTASINITTYPSSVLLYYPADNVQVNSYGSIEITTYPAVIDYSASGAYGNIEITTYPATITGVYGGESGVMRGLNLGLGLGL